MAKDRRTEASQRVLVVDDDAELRPVLKEILDGEGFAVTVAADGIEALGLFKRMDVDAVLLDMRMPRMQGLEAMRAMLKLDRRAQIVILTAHGDLETAVQAVKEGAYDFVAKPPDYDKLIITLRRAAERRALERAVDKAQKALDLTLGERLGSGAAIRSVIGLIEQVADTNLSVVIQGETGTGKSYIANTIHSLSARAGKPFVRVDIGLIPDQLVESELFGFRTGAFTGASRNRDGYFKEAEGGTLFIDDLENMSQSTQQKLLTVADEGKIHLLGSSATQDVDVRIIAATNKGIEEAVARGDIRSDLYYRLAEFVITLPPLRERKDEIATFARRFLVEICAELQRPVPDIEDETIGLLEKYRWPGNLRELKNVVRRLVLAVSSGRVDASSVRSLLAAQPFLGGGGPVASSLKDAVRAVEERMIRQALELTKGNKTQAAVLLQISYPTLLSKVKEYRLN